MYTPITVKYSFIVNELDDKDNRSQTLKVIHITGSATERCSLFRKFLRHTYALSRKEASRVIREFGFDDLIPCGN